MIVSGCALPKANERLCEEEILLKEDCIFLKTLYNR